jgi:hypothetical protein
MSWQIQSKLVCVAAVCCVDGRRNRNRSHSAVQRIRITILGMEESDWMGGGQIGPQDDELADFDAHRGESHDDENEESLKLRREGPVPVQVGLLSVLRIKLSSMFRMCC